MPKDTSIKKILVIGSGPIVIGQGCEFDSSGVQACKALREEGYQVVLVNSNPATIMTDPEFAFRTYIEPITPEVVEKIICPGNPTLVDCFLETGRTHQIRVHLKHLNHPLLGDPLYGRRESYQRQMLHAWKLGFTHPRTNEWLQFESVIPEDFVALDAVP